MATLATGYQEDSEELECLDKFMLATVQNKLLGPVQYVDKDGKSAEVLQIYGKRRVLLNMQKRR